MSSTGPIESWNVNPINVGPIYPFAGWEPLMFIACGAFCLFFVVWKFWTENSKYSSGVREIRKRLNEPNHTNEQSETL